MVAANVKVKELDKEEHPFIVAFDFESYTALSKIRNKYYENDEDALAAVVACGLQTMLENI